MSNRDIETSRDEDQVARGYELNLLDQDDHSGTHGQDVERPYVEVSPPKSGEGLVNESSSQSNDTAIKLVNSSRKTRNETQSRVNYTQAAAVKETQRTTTKKPRGRPRKATNRRMPARDADGKFLPGTLPPPANTNSKSSKANRPNKDGRRTKPSNDEESSNDDDKASGSLRFLHNNRRRNNERMESLQNQISALTAIVEKLTTKVSAP